MRFRTAIYLSLALALLIFLPTFAQSPVSAVLSPPQLQSFPTFTALLDARGEGGAFLSGLQPGQVTLLENGREIIPDRVTERQPGLTLVTAVTPGRDLVRRDSNGRSRWEAIQEALSAWSGSVAPNPDDRFTLVMGGQPPIQGITSAEDLLALLRADQTDFREAVPGVESLAAALDLAAGAPGGAGKRAVLWIASFPENQSEAIQALKDRAVQAGIPVFVWMIAYTDVWASPTAQAMAALAQESGGQFAAYSGAESLPNLEDWLGPLRPLYELTYQTRVTTSGGHTLSAVIRTEQGEVTSNEQSFDLDVRPPNPIFLSPPTRITRTAPPESETPELDLEPNTVPLQILIEFPDDLQRPVAASRLLVNGEVVTENTAEPFDQFEWDISAIDANGRYSLQAEVEDNLGLSSQSIALPVEVVIQIPQPPWWQSILRNNRILGAAAGLVAAASLALVIVFLRRRSRRVRRAPGRPVPAAAPVPSRPIGGPAQPAQTASAWWPRSEAAPTATANLVRVDENLGPLPGAPLPLLGPEVTLGRDPARATCLLDDPSVDPLHARLVMVDSESLYQIYDQNSTAGVWVNYCPVPPDGAALRHGDILHLGGLAFRFALQNPPPLQRPVVRTEEATR